MFILTIRREDGVLCRHAVNRVLVSHQWPLVMSEVLLESHAKHLLNA